MEWIWSHHSSKRKHHAQSVRAQLPFPHPSTAWKQNREESTNCWPTTHHCKSTAYTILHVAVKVQVIIYHEHLQACESPQISSPKKPVWTSFTRGLETQFQITELHMSWMNQWTTVLFVYNFAMLSPNVESMLQTQLAALFPRQISLAQAAQQHAQPRLWHHPATLSEFAYWGLVPHEVSIHCTHSSTLYMLYITVWIE